jgi:TolB-like protein/DNA-binding winged helix-turn-helix (wHTH) protein
MQKVRPSQETICFGGFEVDLRNGEVRKHGFRIRLQDQPFHVLQVLLEHPGELVAREELQRQIWPADTFVDFEKGLNNAIKRLRDALGDSAEQPRFIETHSRRGYRFIGTVTATNGAGRAEEKASIGEAVVPPQSRPLYRRFAIGVVLFLAFVATLVGLDIGGLRRRLLIKANPPVIHSLAVLPLANLSNDPNQDYFSDGMTDALITDLAQIGYLKVISRTSIMRYKKTDKSLPEIARELNVDGIVEGTVQRSGDHVRITAQLIDGPSDKHVWARSYERDMQDVLVLERAVTQEIARQIQEQVTPHRAASLQQPRPVNAKALEAYLQGEYYDRQSMYGGDGEKSKAAEYFQQAIDADPNFAPAYNGLANAHFNLLWPSSQDAEIVRTAAKRALELDPTFSDARVTLGYLMLNSWDFRGAEDELRQAVALNPNNASAHDILSQLLYDIGRLDEGWREMQIAQELDPNCDHLSTALDHRREHDRAIAWGLMMLKTDPDNPYSHFGLFRSYAGKGMHKEGFQELEKGISLFGLPETAARMHHAFAISGYRAGMQELTGDMEHLAATKQMFVPVELAEVYAAMGDKERAFYWLEEAYKHRDMAPAADDAGLVMINVDHMMDPLRADPRFKDLVRRVGLSP